MEALLTDIQLIFGIMSALNNKQYSFDDLLYLTDPFEVTETSLRTSLSRMIRENTIQSTKHGKTAFYSLSQKGSRIRSNVALSLKGLNWSQWNMQWWGLLFSVPDMQNQQRHKIRKKLVAHRFANYYSGFWIRPIHPDEKIQENFQSLIHTGNCTLIQFKFEQEITINKIKTIWKLDDVNALFETTIKYVNEHLDMACVYTPEQGLFFKFMVGNDIINALFHDPLLPNEFLPDNWKGNELRQLLIKFDKTMTAIAKPYVEKVYHKE